MPKDLRQFLSRFETSLLDLARSGHSIQLKKKLDDFESLLQCWLDVTRPDMGTFSGASFFELTPRFRGPLEVDLYDLVQMVAASRDRDSYEHVVNSLTSWLFMARSAERLRLYTELTRIMTFSYRCAAREEDLWEVAGRVHDNRLHSILSPFKSRWTPLDPMTAEQEEATFGAERPYLDAALGLTLDLTATAMEQSREKHAGYFLHRLSEHRQFSNRRWRPGATAPTDEDAGSLHDYALVATGAWALHLLEANHGESAKAARSVLSAVTASLPARHELIALRELYRSHREIDERLGIARWDLRDRGEIRSGVGMASSKEDWMERGFFALLLRSREPHRRAVDEYFTSAPPRYMWDADRLTPLLKQLAQLAWLGVAESERDSVVAATVELVRRRQFAADSAYLRRVASAGLDTEKRNLLIREVLEGREREGRWFRVVRELGGTKGEAAFATPTTLAVEAYIPRQYLALDANNPSGLGGHFGEDAALWEAVRLVQLLSTVVPVRFKVAALAKLSDVIEAAVDDLAGRRVNANMIILPRQERFAGALFRRPLWQLEDRGIETEICYGMWNGIHVLKCPFSDCERIIVGEASRLFGSVDDRAGAPQVLLTDTEAEKLADFRDRVDAADGGKLPSPDELKVLLTLLARPAVGVNDPSGGVGIDITESDGGYALIPGESVYHRPSCPEIEFRDDVQYSLRKSLSDEAVQRQPCSTCHPERWDREGRRGSPE